VGRQALTITVAVGGILEMLPMYYIVWTYLLRIRRIEGIDRFQAIEYILNAGVLNFVKCDAKCAGEYAPPCYYAYT
jgi:hypothetical protein